MTVAKHVRILSLGGGVQSTTIALMCAHGEIAPPCEAIFADTGAEPATVYKHLEWLKSEIPKLPFPFPIVTVSAGNLGDEILATSRGEKRNDARPPFYVKNKDGTRGILRRQCTGDYKIDPIRKRARELMGVVKGHRVPSDCRVTMVIGISRDEAGRMTVARDKWQTNEYPLVDRRLTRHDCTMWLARHGYSTPPKSACVFCPYRRAHEWRVLRDTDPVGFQHAIEIDRAIRAPGYCGLVGESYIHDSMQPLESVDLSTDAERGQPNLWDDECDGMCGV